MKGVLVDRSNPKGVKTHRLRTAGVQTRIFWKAQGSGGKERLGVAQGAGEELAERSLPFVPLGGWFPVQLGSRARPFSRLTHAQCETHLQMAELTRRVKVTTAIPCDIISAPRD